MKVRLYDRLNPQAMSGFAKFRQAIEADDFIRAQISKVGPNLYRARLGRSDRLLFSFYSHGGTTDCLVLEHVPNHDYAKSRFLNHGSSVHPGRIKSTEVTEADAARIETLDSIQSEPIAYLNPESDSFHVLDKVLSFDAEQEQIFALPAPLIIVGSAGSGKTALTLEKMKQATGDVLYISLSPYLIENARELYHAHAYQNDDQNLDFLSFREYLETIEVPPGREVQFQDFNTWFQRHKAGTGFRDAHSLYEEFRGVITGTVSVESWLSRVAYRSLGVRQSIFAESQRDAVYSLFERYLQFLKHADLFDPNVVCHQYRQRIVPAYDFIVIDEVQDFTNIQLLVILSALRNAGNFLLCGDANQIVHPNFFSWSALKSFFHDNRQYTGVGQTLHVLSANYRNSDLVTASANRVLKLKHARFGSVDRESNHLVSSRGQSSGNLQLLKDELSVREELNQKTGRSTRFAVLVMHAEDKAEARRLFSTPLVFSIQEAKGLEYDSIILFNFIAGEDKAFRDIASGVDVESLEGDSLNYARAKSKQDKSLEIYKFYINALYVAITRAVKNLYIVEQKLDHPVIHLLDLERFAGTLTLEEQGSSLEEWQREARKLELQGKREQAEAIQSGILERKPVPWPVFDRVAFDALRTDAFATSHKKKLLQVFEYAVLHQHQSTLTELINRDYRPARQPEDKALKQLHRQHYLTYDLGKPVAVLKDTERYGVDHRTVFNLTPLMVAAHAGNAELIQALLERGANTQLVANHGLNAYQMSLERAVANAAYSRQKSANVHALLKPQSLSIQVDGRLIKLGGHLMGLFLLNLMFAQFYRQLNAKSVYGEVFNARTFTTWVEHLPDSVLPPKRKRQSYISSVLSGNEVSRDAPYNRKLFRRLSRGQYIINPNLKLRIDEQWVPVHDLLILDDLAPLVPVHSASIPLRSEKQREIRREVQQEQQIRYVSALNRFRDSITNLIQLRKPDVPQEDSDSQSVAHSEANSAAGSIRGDLERAEKTS